MARRRVRLKSLGAGWGPLKADIEVQEGDRALLHPLFVTLRDRRAILYSPRGRMDQPYIVASIEEIRAKLTETLATLGPDSEAAVWLEKMRVACREFLDAVAGTRNSPEPNPDLEPALHQLRDMVRTVANHVSALYRLPAAAALVGEMNESDRLVAKVDAGNLTPEDLGGRGTGVRARSVTTGATLPGAPSTPPPADS